MNTQYRGLVRFSWFIFSFTFLVILAGGVVRMTQSGMGCPDWPKCFGLWIPPTDASQLPADFESYLSKQDIDHSFNVYHTWIEYINRLLGALLGLFILAYVGYVAVWFRKYKRGFTRVSLLLLVGVILQGILGAIVVYQNLAVSTVTIHLIGAMIIAILPLVNIAKTKYRIEHINRGSIVALVIFSVLILIQFLLGTQVRENVDEVSKALMYDQRSEWIAGLDVTFIIHRSFTWIVLLSFAVFLYSARFHDQIKRFGFYLGGLILFNVLLGIIMTYLDMPAIAQPLHLIGGSLLFILSIYILLRVRLGKSGGIISPD